MEKERNHLIDAIRCLACLGVVMLHMPAVKFQKEIIDVQDMLGRCGVPLFFMISGYFAAKHVEKDPGSSRWFFKRAVKMLQQFVIFELIFLICYCLNGFVSLAETGTFSLDGEAIWKLAVFNVPLFSGILWYLLAYAYCLVIYGIASYFKRGYHFLTVISPVLLLLYYLLGKYSVIFFDVKIPYYWSRNFLFAAVPLFTIGFNMPKINIKWLTDRTIMIFSLLSVCLLFAESMAFHANPSIQGANNYIFNTVFAFLVIYYATHDPQITVSEDHILAVIGRKYSLYIYAFQGIAAKLCSTTVQLILKLDKNAGTFAISFYHITKPICVFLMGLLMAYVYVKMIEILNARFTKKVLIR